MSSPFVVSAAQLAQSETFFVVFQYGACAAKLEMRRNERGTLIVCPRCGVLCRGLHQSPGNRGLCCVDCRMKAAHALDTREPRKAAPKPKAKPKAPAPRKNKSKTPWAAAGKGKTGVYS